MIAPTNKMSTNSTQQSFPSRPRSRSRGSGLPRTLTFAAIAVVVLMAAVKASSEVGVQLTGAGNARLNGWYARKTAAEGPPRCYSGKATKWSQECLGRHWYEKADGAYIFHRNDKWSPDWRICAPNDSAYTYRSGYYVPANANPPPVKWKSAHDFQDGPAPTLRLVNHKKGHHFHLGYASNRRRLVATSSEKVEVTGAGTAQVNGLYHQMKPSDGPPKGWPYTESLFWKKANQRWYEKDDGCYIHRSGSSWYISTPDGYGSRYECRVPCSHDRAGAGPPSTEETANYLRWYSKGWEAIWAWTPGAGGRAPVPTVRVN